MPEIKPLTLSDATDVAWIIGAAQRKTRVVRSIDGSLYYGTVSHIFEREIGPDAPIVDREQDVRELYVLVNLEYGYGSAWWQVGELVTDLRAGLLADAALVDD